MKLHELKKLVWSAWCNLNSWQGELTSTPESYMAEIKSFGDRRLKSTWIKAFSRFEAMFTYETASDSWGLIGICLNFTPDRQNYAYRHEILDEFLLYPDGLDMLKDALEHLFSSNFSPKDRDEAYGFFKLAAQSQNYTVPQILSEIIVKRSHRKRKKPTW
jgi:hypothetical protein